VVGIVGISAKVLAVRHRLNGRSSGPLQSRFCDAFAIPILSLRRTSVATCPGATMSHARDHPHGAPKLLYAYAEATVPQAHRDHVRKRTGRCLFVMSAQQNGGGPEPRMPPRESGHWTGGRP